MKGKDVEGVAHCVLTGRRKRFCRPLQKRQRGNHNREREAMSALFAVTGGREEMTLERFSARERVRRSYMGVKDLYVI